MKLKLLFLLVLLVAAVGLTRAFHLSHLLSLENLREHEEALLAYRSANPTLSLVAFVSLYIAVAALSIPGAMVLTLAGGAIFGFAIGLVAVSFASTIGATLGFLVSRFLFRDFIQKRFGDKLVSINEGVLREGAFFLFTLRLVPVFPFFLINLAMGLTPISVFTFFFVSQIGMLPGTAAYVNAGTQLGQIHSLKGILSPGLWISFAVVGVLPLFSKWVIAIWKRRQAFRRFRIPKVFDYNVVVLGAGAAGLVSSYIAAAVKAKVALIEKHRMGGDCLNTGCVPSKAFIRSSKIFSYIRRSKEFGLGESQTDLEFAKVMERVQKVITKIAPHDSVERYEGLGVECLQGEAKILSPFEVKVGEKTLTTKAIIVATGAKPLVPAIPGLEDVGYLTSDTVWNLKALPKRFLVLGGGPIGCELAQSFARFGSEVTQVEALPRILPREDEEVSQFILEKFQKDGMRVLVNHKATRFYKKDEDKFMLCESNGQEVRIAFDEVLLALGRKPNTKGFGLEALGVELSKTGTIANDPFLRTNIPNIYVCGDVAGPYLFTHVAAHQAWYASMNALFSPFKSFRADYRVIPWSTFTHPEVARVGLNEQEAKEKGIEYEVTRYGLEELDRAIAEEEAQGFIKVLTPPGKDKILGVTIIGKSAGETISEYVTAMKHGLGLNKILGTIHIYPTLTEGNKYAAGNWRRAHAPAFALRVLERFHAWRRG